MQDAELAVLMLMRPPASHRRPWRRSFAPSPVPLPNLPFPPSSPPSCRNPLTPLSSLFTLSPSIAFPLFFPPSDPSSSASGPLLGAASSGTSGSGRESFPCDAIDVPPQVEPASISAPSLPSASSSFLSQPPTDVPLESVALPSPSWADAISQDSKPSGDSIPAPHRSKPPRKSPSKPKPSGRLPPSAPAGMVQEGLRPKNLANSVEAGVKTASAVPTSNAFAALQNPEKSILPEEPQGVLTLDSDNSSRD
ncbi:hypothetical protein Nepgr_023920 [Nepenthes gracilis]|uniref:Uncharacterized protein n=1 Tax=Nepenthes gracilis TaxID=150966 RepID=A0AAD3XY49_NEPGR|nr:hypothetical protein Nepgr_023920 [Nepenthes gracilis]